MTLSVIGGLMGIALGLALALATVPVLDIPFVLDPAVMFGAVIFSAFVGVAFGFLPARRAARLDPIVALRHE